MLRKLASSSIGVLIGGRCEPKDVRSYRLRWMPKSAKKHSLDCRQSKGIRSGCWGIDSHGSKTCSNNTSLKHTGLPKGCGTDLSLAEGLMQDNDGDGITARQHPPDSEYRHEEMDNHPQKTNGLV